MPKSSNTRSDTSGHSAAPAWPGLAAQTLPESLARAAGLAGDAEAIVCEGERITFAQLADRVHLLKRGMIEIGVRRGDHVGICMGNSVEWVALFFAAAHLGAVTVPINTRLKPDEISYCVRQSRISTLFIVDRFLKIDFVAMFREICPGIDEALPDAAFPHLARIVVVGDEIPAGTISFEDMLTRGADAAEPAESPAPGANDPLLIQYTSGTTSFPKGVTLSHRNMMLDAYFAGLHFGLRPGERYLSPRPFFHVAGSTLSILASLQHLACLVSVKRFDAGQLLELAERERCTLLSGNDTIFLMLMNHPDLARRKLTLRGGWAAASPAVVSRIIETLGMAEVSVAYGLSEASPNVAMARWWDPVEDRIAGKLRLLPGVDVEIRTEGEVLPPGVEGEIHVRGWNVMLGYFDKPAETAEALQDGWLRTGDLGRMTDDGRLVFVGRAKDITRVGGENVANLEIEDVLHAHPDVQQAQVIAIPDERLVEVPAAFVITTSGAKIDDATLLAWLKPRLASYKLPRRFWFIESFDEIGMTASSKIQKRHLSNYAKQIIEAEREREPNA